VPILYATSRIRRRSYGGDSFAHLTSHS